MSTKEDLKALRLALAKGPGPGEGQILLGKGSPLRVESIDKTLRQMTYRMEGAEPAMRLTMLSGQQEINWAQKPTMFSPWKALPQDLGAYNTVDEYNQLVSLEGGDEG